MADPIQKHAQASYNCDFYINHVINTLPKLHRIATDDEFSLSAQSLAKSRKLKLIFTHMYAANFQRTYK